jgi:hypothetical protein
MEKFNHDAYRDNLAHELKDQRDEGSRELANDYLEYKKKTAEYKKAKKLHGFENKDLSGLDSGELIKIGKSLDTPEKWAEIIGTGKITGRELFDSVLVDIGVFDQRRESSKSTRYNVFNEPTKEILGAIKKVYKDTDLVAECSVDEIWLISGWMRSSNYLSESIPKLKMSESQKLYEAKSVYDCHAGTGNRSDSDYGKILSQLRLDNEPITDKFVETVAGLVRHIPRETMRKVVSRFNNDQLFSIVEKQQYGEFLERNSDIFNDEQKVLIAEKFGDGNKHIIYSIDYRYVDWTSFDSERLLKIGKKCHEYSIWRSMLDAGKFNSRQLLDLSKKYPKVPSRGGGVEDTTRLIADYLDPNDFSTEEISSLLSENRIFAWSDFLKKAFEQGKLSKEQLKHLYDVYYDPDDNTLAQKLADLLNRAK